MLGVHEAHPFGVTGGPPTDSPQAGSHQKTYHHVRRVSGPREPEADHKKIKKPAKGTRTWQAPPPPPPALPPSPPPPRLSLTRRLCRWVLVGPQIRRSRRGWKQGSRDGSTDREWPSRRDEGQVVPAHNLLGEEIGGRFPLTAAVPWIKKGFYRKHPVESQAEVSMIRRWMECNAGGIKFAAAWRLAGAVDPLPDRPDADGCPYERPRLVGFHGTSEAAVESIVREGFATPTREGLLGRRVYLARDCGKAAYYSMTKDSNLLLICHFDPGSMLVVGGNREGWKEPVGWDTIKAIPPFVRSTPSEYGINYQSGSARIVPAYVVRFTPPEREARFCYGGRSAGGDFPCMGYRCPVTKVLYRDPTGLTLGEFGQNW